MITNSTLQSTFNDAPAVAFIGQLDSNRHTNKTTARNAEVTASMPFGAPVVYKPATTSDLDALLPANATDHLRGIVYRTDSYMPAFTDVAGTHGELGATGLIPGTVMDVARRGRIWVKCMTGCAQGDAVKVSYAAGGGTYTAAGQYGNAVAAGSVIDCAARAQWDSTAVAGAGAWLLFDFSKSV